MKHIIILLMAISLFSCSFFNDTKVDFSIKNNSQKVLKNIVFKTRQDSIVINELKPNESFEKEILYSNSSDREEDKSSGFWLNFYRDTIKNDSFFCVDVLNDNSNKKVHLIILENEIKSEIEGIECF